MPAEVTLTQIPSLPHYSFLLPHQTTRSSGKTAIISSTVKTHTKALAATPLQLLPVARSLFSKTPRELRLSPP